MDEELGLLSFLNISIPEIGIGYCGPIQLVKMCQATLEPGIIGASVRSAESPRAVGVLSPVNHGIKVSFKMNDLTLAISEG